MSPEDLEAQFEAFLIEAHRLKALYAPQITLLVGAETEHITAIDLDNLETLLERHRERIEFLVGSVHHVNEVPIDFDEKTLSGLLDTFTTSLSRPDEVTQREKLMSLYFDAQYEVLRRFRPEVIGHFDLCRLYFPAVEFGAYPAAMSKIERNIRLAVDYGALFEINAAGFRKGWRTACPGADVIQVRRTIGAHNLYFQRFDILYFIVHSTADYPARRTVHHIRRQSRAAHSWLELRSSLQVPPRHRFARYVVFARGDGQ